MKNCPYCNGIVQDDNATFCPNCGMAWTAEQEAGRQPLEPQAEQPQTPEAPSEPDALKAPPEPEVQEQPAAPEAPMAPDMAEQTPVAEQQPATYQQGGQQPPPQYQGQQSQQPQQQQPQFYQQPDGQQMRTCLQCGRGIPVDYKVCPHCGRRTVQEPPPRPAPRPAPQPQYQRQMPPPRPMGPPPPRGRAGAGGMVGAIIGAIMIIIGSFILWSLDLMGTSTFIGVDDLDRLMFLISLNPDNFIYVWLIPIFGILVIIFAPIAYGIQSRGLAMASMVFGLLAFLLAILLPIHMALSSNGTIEIVELFYTSDIDSSLIYMGGFMAIFGGISAMSGAASLGGAIKRANPPRQQYPSQYQQGYRRY